MDYNSYIYKLNDIFIKNFEKEYSVFKKNNKCCFLKYFNAIYRKWYYAALFEENILSPAHLIYRLNEKHNSFGKLELPVLQPVSAKKYDGFNVIIKEYTNDSHPIVNDLKIFVECFKNDVLCIDENEFLSEEAIDMAIRKVSLYDPFYLEYLFYLAAELKLLKKMPSIYSEVYSVCDDFYLFFEQDVKKIFEDVISACIKIACDKLNDFMPLTQKMFSEEYIKSIIVKPILVDELFKDIYDTVGIDIEEMWQSDGGDEMSSMILSSAYFLGIMVDKWFVTPFGYYLNFIMPLYIFPYDFKEEMYRFYDDINLNGNISMSPVVYSPCSRYFITELGKQYFNIKNVNDDYKKLFQKFPVDGLIDLITDSAEQGSLDEIEDILLGDLKIYELKVKMYYDKSYWKILEIQENKTLEALHYEICSIIGLNYHSEYSFFADETRNPFAEYTSAHKVKRTSKKTENTLLSDLELLPHRKLIYRSQDIDDLAMFMFGENEMLAEIEVLGVKDKKRGVKYPCITHMSKTAREVEDELKFF